MYGAGRASEWRRGRREDEWSRRRPQIAVVLSNSDRQRRLSGPVTRLYEPVAIDPTAKMSEVCGGEKKRENGGEAGMQTERGRRSTIKSMAWLRAALPPPSSSSSSSSSSRPEFRPPAVPCDGDHPSNRSHGVPAIETLRGEGTWRRRSAVPGGSPGLR